MKGKQKNKMKKGLVLPFILFILLLLIAGCGEKAEEADVGEVETMEEVTEEETEETAIQTTNFCGEVGNVIKEICGAELTVTQSGASKTDCVSEYKPAQYKKYFTLTYDPVEIWLAAMFINTQDNSLKEGTEKIEGNWDKGYFRTITETKESMKGNIYGMFIVKNNIKFYLQEMPSYTGEMQDFCTKEQYKELAEKIIELWPA